MWSDMNTKPLQGMKFQKMRAQVMGIAVEYDDNTEHQRTHPLLMPKVEPIALSWDDKKVLKARHSCRPLAVSNTGRMGHT